MYSTETVRLCLTTDILSHVAAHDCMKDGQCLMSRDTCDNYRVIFYFNVPSGFSNCMSLYRSK